MMTKIKFALAFLWGSAYTAAWFLLFTLQPVLSPVEKAWLILPIIFIAVTTIYILVQTVNFLADNWKED